MKNTAGENVKRIIEKEFDSRVSMMVVSYIMDKGFENLKEITEEEILEFEGNALMTDRFVQSLVRAAVRIAKECNSIDEFLPYIVNYLYVPNAKMKEIEIYKEETDEDLWERLMEKLDLDYEEDADNIETIIVNANVMETYSKEEYQYGT